MARILIVEDEHALGGALALVARKMGHDPVLAGTGAQAREELGKARYAAMVLDIGLPDMSGVDLLGWVREAGAKIPVLVITAHAVLDHAIAARKLGVADYLIKPLDLVVFENALSSMVSKGGYLASPDATLSHSLIGAAASMHRVFLDVSRACVEKLPVLISGPCGSGKTHTARVIHGNRGHGIRDLHVFECSALTDANALQSSLVEGNGTVLLENLQDLSRPMQEVLADGFPFAGGRGPGVIATMTVSPQEALTRGMLREDLYYGFSATSIELPPLADRAGDIPALSRFFAAAYDWKQPGLELSEHALAALQCYSWPGNVRELRHVLEHARAMSHGETVYLGHLPPHVASAFRDPGEGAVPKELEISLARWLDLQLEILPEKEWRYDDLLGRVESRLLAHLLAKFDGKPTRLAAAMRMNRATLRQKLRRWNLG